MNTIEPSPVNEASKNGKLEFTLGHIAAGNSFTLFMQFQVDPTTVGRQIANTELWDGKSRILTIPRSITIYP